MTYPGIEHDETLLAAAPDMAAVIARRKEREEEFGVWVAVRDIPWGTVLAATPGMAIPQSTVDRLKWDEIGLVARRDSTEGREVLTRTNQATPEEREAWAEADKASAKEAAETQAAAEKTDSEPAARRATGPKGGTN